MAVRSILQQTLELVEGLPPEDRRLLVELIERQLAEERRDEIARNAATTLKAVQHRRARLGNLDDLKKDLLR
jgi:hypothetical protein